MRKINYYIGMAVATVLTAASCVKEIAREEGVDNSFDVVPELTAGFDEEQTKTYVENNVSLKWHDSDVISAFVGNTLNSKYAFEGKTGDNSGSFCYVDSKGTDGGLLSSIYAIYPYSESASISEDGVISLELPQVQKFGVASFGANANTMIAVTENVEDTHLSFKNACGFMKFKFYSESEAWLKSVSVSGNDNEKIAGAAVVTMQHGGVPTLSIDETATTSIQVLCDRAIKLSTSKENPTEVWVVVPETTFGKGITVTVTDDNGGVFVKSTSNEISVTRNEIQPMAALEVIYTQASPKDNEIWYTASSKVDLYSSSAFFEKVVSNEYDAEAQSGIIVFDAPISKIGSNAFKGKTALKSIILPEGVVKIETDAFNGCTGLQYTFIPSSVVDIASGSFTDCTGELVLNATVTEGFNKSKFSKVTIGENVTAIPSFSGNTSLVEVSMSDVVAIGQSAFNGCTSLERVNTGNKVEEIGASAFYNCTKLTSITLSPTLKKIGSQAFYQTALSSVELPEGLESLGQFAFDLVKTLTEVHIPMSVTDLNEYGVFHRCSGITKFTGKFATEDGRALVRGVRLVDYAAGNPATSYSVPEGITTIGYALDNCTLLKELELPTTLEYIPHLEGCTLVTIRSKALTPPRSTISPWKPFKNSSTAQIFVPAESVDKYKAASGWYTYKDIICGYYDDISNVVLSDKKIVYYATEKVEPSKLAGFGATYVCTIYDETTGRGEICFDADITTIPNNAFLNKSALTSVSIPEGVTTIGSDAFYGCTSLESVDLPNTLTEIGMSAFYRCSSLSEIVIPSGVKTIAAYVFQSCNNLKVVKLPSTITQIGYYAFLDATSLTTVYCDALTPPSLSSSFENTNSTFRIYVPSDAVSSYQTKWSAYKTRIYGRYVMNDDIPVGYSVTLKADANNYAWVKSSTYANPNVELYDGVFESTNVRMDDSESVMYIDINGLTSFSFYIKASSESSFDKVMVSQLDMPINGNTSTYNNSAVVKATASGTGKDSDWSIDGYTKVSFDDIDGGAHRITVIYSKDDEDNKGNDTGYVLIPREYGSNLEPEPIKTYTVSLNQWNIQANLNPDPSSYDGVYRSTNTAHSTLSTMYVDIEGYTSFKLYIRCNNKTESMYDYVVVSKLDGVIGDGITYNNTNVYASTYNVSNADTTISGYTLVQFDNIDGGKHRITIGYRKDSSYNDGDNKGYVLIPKNQ